VAFTYDDFGGVPSQFARKLGGSWFGAPRPQRYQQVIADFTKRRFDTI
jgi:hypothetical protein